MRPTWKSELLALLRLAMPVMTVQVGMMTMGFMDTIMVGHFAEHDLAAAALGHLYSQMLIMFGVGVLMALDPVMSQAVGAGADDAISRNLQRGLILAVALTVPTAVLYTFVEPSLGFLEQDPGLIPKASAYVWTLIPSILPFFCFGVLRTMLQAHHKTAPIVWTILVANLVNVFLNWVLIFGNLGWEEMGVVGSAYATLTSRWLMLVFLVIVERKRILHHILPWSRRAFDLGAMRRLLKVGVPIGTQIFLEIGAFCATLLLMGSISVSALAGHQAAIQLASMTYMVTVGLSIATGVRVANGVGRGDFEGARWSAAMGLLVGALIMVFFAVVFMLFPRSLAALFTENEEVGAHQIAAMLLPIAAVFQVMDGLQVVALGVLRGVADTKVPLLIHLLGFWCLGLPCGYWLAFGIEEQPQPGGLWWGLTIGLGVVAVALLHRVWTKLRGDLSRTVIDAD